MSQDQVNTRDKEGKERTNKGVMIWLRGMVLRDILGKAPERRGLLSGIPADSFRTR